MSETTPTAQDHPTDDHGLPKDLKPASGLLVLVMVLVFLGLLTALFFVGWVPHEKQERQAEADAKETSIGAPVVSVEHPRAATGSKDLMLPGNVDPEQETAIFSRANGYLKKLNCDIGDHVNTGDVLAEIDTPEVDAQLAQSKAALEQAKVNVRRQQEHWNLAQRTFERYDDFAKKGTGGVTQQQLDEVNSAAKDAADQLAAAKSAVIASEADMQRLTTLVDFEKVIAPFSGTITARNYDLGALLSSDGSGKELFHLAKTDLLRVFVEVPQPYATLIKLSQPAFLSVRNYPGREFSGVIARTAGALNANSRTLRFELHFPNSDGSLYAGMYGQARLPVSQDKPVLMIPSSALVFNASGMQVALVRDGKALPENYRRSRPGDGT